MPRCWSAPSTKDAYRLSWVSIIITLLAAVAGILMYWSTGSSLALVFGLENCVDFLSSAVVLWRFFAPAKLDPELDEKLSRREKRASMAISFIMIILGIVIIGTAIQDFKRGDEGAEHSEEIMAVSFFSLLIFGTLAAFKFHYSNCLDSASLYKDGLCSLIGTILAGTLFINTIIIEGNSDFWFIDPVVSFCCGIGALVLGIWHVYQARHKDNLPIFSVKWWAMSQGDGKDEKTGRPIGPEDMPVGLNESLEKPDAEVV